MQELRYLPHTKFFFLHIPSVLERKRKKKIARGRKSTWRKLVSATVNPEPYSVQ